MKRKIFITITLALMTCSLMSCKATSSKAQAENDAKEVLAADTLVVSRDSCVIKEGNSLICTIRVDYPTEPNDLSKSIRSIINQELTKQYLGNTNGENAKTYKGYNGDLSNGKAVIEQYGKDNFSYLKEQLKDITSIDPRANINMSCEIDIYKAAETDSYITYDCFSYTYLGGAHGSSTNYAINIDKASGKALLQTVDTTQVKALQPLLRKGVLSYLKESDAEVSDSTLNDYLFIDNGIIPMPAFTPSLTKEGVHFIYQQYEIGPYAMGMVNFTINYADIKPFLTKEAEKLLK